MRDRDGEDWERGAYYCGFEASSGGQAVQCGSVHGAVPRVDSVPALPVDCWAGRGAGAVVECQ